jgi:DNA-directed RNA polymerase sigma subunit (sigma70/sigma32)
MNNTKMILEFANQTEDQTDLECFVSDQVDEVSDTQEEYDEETLKEEERILSVRKTSSTNYNASIDAIPVLSFEEEVRYARMIRAAMLLSSDDHSFQAQETRRKAELAKQVLIEHNLRLVRSMARKS